jgi:hypothetical protein
VPIVWFHRCGLGFSDRVPCASTQITSPRASPAGSLGYLAPECSLHLASIELVGSRRLVPYPGQRMSSAQPYYPSAASKAWTFSLGSCCGAASNCPYVRRLSCDHSAKYSWIPHSIRPLRLGLLPGSWERSNHRSTRSWTHRTILASCWRSPAFFCGGVLWGAWCGAGATFLNCEFNVSL